MPRYFFHRTDGYVENDQEGVELSDLAAARLSAAIFAGETLKEDPKRIWDGSEFHVEVTDGEGALLFTVITECIEAPSTKTQRFSGPIDPAPAIKRS